MCVLYMFQIWILFFYFPRVVDACAPASVLRSLSQICIIQCLIEIRRSRAPESNFSLTLFCLFHPILKCVRIRISRFRSVFDGKLVVTLMMSMFVIFLPCVPLQLVSFLNYVISSYKLS